MQQYDDATMKEEGVVTELIGGLAKIETTQTEACHHCGMKGACSTMGGMKKREIVVKNPLQAKEGDLVMIAVPRKGVMGAGFLVYLVPIITLLLGAALGSKLGPKIGLNAQDGSVILGLLGLVIPWGILFFISKEIGRKKSLEVSIVKILESGERLRPPEPGGPAEAL